MRHLITNIMRSPIIRGIAAYGSAEAANRVVRLLAVVIIARQIDPLAMGQAAIALSLFELVRALANAGIGQRIITASDADLAATCNRASSLFKWWCFVLAALQVVVAAVLAFGWSLYEAGILLAALSGVYLAMIPGLVQVFLLMRDGRMATTARITATQTIADHILTMTLALVMPGAAAIVLPKLLCAPIWTVLVRRARRWSFDAASGAAPLAPFLRYAGGVLVSELAAAARTQLGTLIVAAVLGVQAVGTFFFALNAGLGITSAIITAFGIVLLPELSRAHPAERHRRFVRAMLLAALLFVPVSLAQSVLAPFYVPLVFGRHWAAAAPLVATLALGMIPLVAAAGASAWFRVMGFAARDAIVSMAAGAAALAGLAAGAGYGLHAAATGYVCGLVLILFPVIAAILAQDAFPSRLKELHA